jgi:Ala-tRNA(Pro) deacylase
MTISAKIKHYLDENGIDYETAEHPLAYTAMEVAGSQHIPGKQMVKSVIVKSGNEFLMCVLPAIHMVDFDKLKKLLDTDTLHLAEEEELIQLFPDYEVGAEPPFGHLYGLPVYADQILREDEEIVFNAGTHTDVIKLKFSDYHRLVKPVMADIGTHI